MYIFCEEWVLFYYQYSFIVLESKLFSEGGNAIMSFPLWSVYRMNESKLTEKGGNKSLSVKNIYSLQGKGVLFSGETFLPFTILLPFSMMVNY